jgi:O-antigen ligase
VESVFTVGQERSAATETLQHKIKNRLPKQLDLIQKRPLTGWAFTEKFIDNDVGNIALIAEAGIIGFIVFLFFWYKMVRVLYKEQKNKHLDKKFQGVYYILFLVFLGLLISHFTTNRIFGYTTFPIFLSLFIVMVNKLYFSLSLSKSNAT